MSAKLDPTTPNIANLLNGLMQHAKVGQSTEWWQTYHYPETVTFSPHDLISCARSALYAQAMANGVVYESRKTLDGHLNVENLEELIRGFDGRRIYCLDDEGDKFLFYVFADGAVGSSVYQWRSQNDNNQIELIIVTLNPDKLNLFYKHYRSCVDE